MLSAITGALGLWGSLAGIGAIVTAVGFLWWRVKASGARAERERQARIDAKARDIRDQIDDAVAGREPSKNRADLENWAR